MSNGQKDKLLFAVPAGRQASIIALVVIHTAGIIGIHSSYRDLFLILSPLNLIICISLLFLNHKKFTQPFALFCVIVFAVGFLIEVIGVKTGIIFGNYSYGNTLGIQFLGVPLIIGINWLMLIYCVGIICNRFYNSSNLLKSMFGAIMMVFLDFFIEPVAIKYDFWSWTKIVIPFQNYIAWYIVSFLFLMLFYSSNFIKENKLAPALFIIQLVFFITLALF